MNAQTLITLLFELIVLTSLNWFFQRQQKQKPLINAINALVREVRALRRDVRELIFRVDHHDQLLQTDTRGKGPRMKHG